MAKVLPKWILQILAYICSTVNPNIPIGILGGTLIIGSIAFCIFYAIGRDFKRSMNLSAIGIYSIFVYESTVLCRKIDVERPIMCTPFWSYHAVFFEKNYAVLWQNLFNSILLVPLLLLLSCYRGKYDLRLSLKICILFSSFIEISQLVFRKGSFELDDIFHNTLGAIIGALLYKIYDWIKNKRVEDAM